MERPALPKTDIDTFISEEIWIGLYFTHYLVARLPVAS